MEEEDSRDCDVVSSEKTDPHHTNDRLPVNEAVIKKVGKSARLLSLYIGLITVTFTV